MFKKKVFGHLKKDLALLLSAAMVLGTFAPVSAAEADVSEEIFAQEEAVLEEESAVADAVEETVDGEEENYSVEDDVIDLSIDDEDVEKGLNLTNVFDASVDTVLPTTYFNFVGYGNFSKDEKYGVINGIKKTFSTSPKVTGATQFKNSNASNRYVKFTVESPSYVVVAMKATGTDRNAYLSVGENPGENLEKNKIITADQRNYAQVYCTYVGGNDVDCYITTDNAFITEYIGVIPVASVPTSWDFTNGNYYDENNNPQIQGFAGEVDGLYIDAATGKFAPRNETSSDAQINNGTKIYVPAPNVSDTSKAKVRVTAKNDSMSYTVGGKAVTTYGEVVLCSASDKPGYVLVQATDNFYIQKIEMLGYEDTDNTEKTAAISFATSDGVTLPNDLENIDAYSFTDATTAGDDGIISNLNTTYLSTDKSYFVSGIYASDDIDFATPLDSIENGGSYVALVGQHKYTVTFSAGDVSDSEYEALNLPEAAQDYTLERDNVSATALKVALEADFDAINNDTVYYAELYDGNTKVTTASLEDGAELTAKVSKASVWDFTDAEYFGKDGLNISTTGNPTASSKFRGATLTNVYYKNAKYGIWFYNKGEIRIPVDRACTVSVLPNYSWNYTIGAQETAVSGSGDGNTESFDYETNETDVENGYVAIAYAGETYIPSISISYPSYAISLPADPENYTITSDHVTATEGTEVALTVTAGSGYEITGVTVSGNTARLKATASADAENSPSKSGVYTFDMPGEAVTVSVTVDELEATLYEIWPQVDGQFTEPYSLNTDIAVSGFGWAACEGQSIVLSLADGYAFDPGDEKGWPNYTYWVDGNSKTDWFNYGNTVDEKAGTLTFEMVPHDIKLWIPVKKLSYTVSACLVDKDGNILSNEPVEITAEHGTLLTDAMTAGSITLPEVEGYVDPKLCADKAGTTELAADYKVPVGGATVYAVYSYRECTITKSGDNVDTFTVSKTSGIKGTEFTVAPAQGYRLLTVMASNATVKTDAESTFVVKGTGDVVVTAGTEETAVAVQVVKDDAQITITGTIPAKMEEDDVITFNVGTKAGYNTPVVDVTGASMSKGSTKKGDGTYENKGKTDEIVVYAPTGNVTITITAKADAASGTVIEEDETYLDTNDMDLLKIGNYSAGKAGYLLTDYDSSSSTKTIDASVLINGAKSAVNKFTLKGKTMVADQVETVTAESGSTFVRRINMGGGDRTITFDVPADSVVTVIGRASGTSSTRGYKFSVGGTLIDEVTFDNSAELPLKTTVHEVSTAGTAEIKSVNNIDIFYIGISAAEKPPVTYAVNVTKDKGITSVKYKDGDDVKELNDGTNLAAGTYTVMIETAEGKVIDKAEGLTPIKDSEKYELTITDKAVTVNVTSKDAEVPPVEEEYDIVLPTGLVLITPESGKAKAGEKITVKADDLDGAVIKGVKVRDKDGNSVEVTDNGDGTYSFSMVEGGLSKIALETEPVLPPTPEEYGEEDKDFRDPVTYDPVLTEKTVKTVSSNYEKMAKLSVKGGAETDVVVKGAFDDTGLLIQHYKGGKVKLVTVSECKVSQNSASSNTVVTVNAKTKVCLPASYANTMSDAPRSTLGHSSKLAALKVNKKGIVKPKAYAGCAIYEAIFTNAAGSTITLRVVSLGFDTSLKKMAVSPSQNLIVRPTMLYGSRDTLIAQGSGLLNGVWTIGKNIVLMPGQTVSDPKTGAKVTLNANGTLKVTNLANKGNLKIAYSLNGRTYKTSIKSQNTKPSGIENYYKALGLLY